MTKKQNAWYWREWGQVKSACVAAKLPVPDRHELHVRALGHDKSHTLFDDEDFDDVLGVFFAISQPANFDLQMRQTKMRKTRRIYKIKRLAPENYWRAESRRKFGTDDLESVSLENLTMLRNHLAARSGKIIEPVPAEAVAELEPAEEGNPF